MPRIQPSIEVAKGFAHFRHCTDTHEKQVDDREHGYPRFKWEPHESPRGYSYTRCSFSCC